jgi:hypothetical protein
MRPSRIGAVAVTLILLSAIASADETPLSQLSGRVSDVHNGGPVEGAFVFVAGTGGLEHVLTTDRAGRYHAAVKPGTYSVVFAQGPSRSSGRVVVGEGAASLDGQVDITAGEVIVIREKLRPPVLPKPTNWSPRKAPPYSDRAVLSDAWTKAWLLLDVSPQGVVERFKFLKRPGYDLDQIAVKEAFKLTFDPARDATGKPVRSWVVWGIEWPSAWWLSLFVGTRSTMPPVVGFPPRRMDEYLPCKGSGGWLMGSLWKGYRDCSTPDLTRAPYEPWILPKQP